MSQPAIRVENLSKQFRIGARQEGYRTLRETLADAAAAPFRRLSSAIRNPKSEIRNPDDTIWALKDVSFEVQPGEVVGIIGRNGAGKSTLLKVLSRITEPTGGRVEIRGRVASLLEVGTGFHPELTGRENILLNGAVLGMSRREILSKFDEIVAFAEVERFIDTPVKRYSSGMYLRLAFAVAAHLDPEILLVDEVLAVGDAAFQKKCLGKMGEVAREGRTVLVVSHQLTLVRNLCQHCLQLASGRAVNAGPTSSVLSAYLDPGLRAGTEYVPGGHERGDLAAPYLVLRRFALVDERSRPHPSAVDPACSAFILIEGDVLRADLRLCVGFCLWDQSGQRVLMSYQTDQHPDRWPRLGCGPVRIRAPLDLRILTEGRYRAEFICGLHCATMFYSPGDSRASIDFEIIGNDARSPYWIGRRDTVLSPVLQWHQV